MTQNQNAIQYVINSLTHLDVAVFVAAIGSIHIRLVFIVVLSLCVNVLLPIDPAVPVNCKMEFSLLPTRNKSDEECFSINLSLLSLLVFCFEDIAAVAPRFHATGGHDPCTRSQNLIVAYTLICQLV